MTTRLVELAMAGDLAGVAAAYNAYTLERNEQWDEAGKWYRVALTNPVGGPEDL